MAKTKLRRWLDRKPVASRPTGKMLAKLFNCSVPTVWGLLGGTRSPSLELALRIERETGGAVKASSWSKVSRG